MPTGTALNDLTVSDPEELQEFLEQVSAESGGGIVATMESLTTTIMTSIE
ncbi:hypothetical protein [Actinacidiphila bryophytorum]|uniref:Uncharacterized protein n=1 Tax=Actinacidiphila bryophytorum TaxID=1436133 RepID=A0A9W4DYZ0_9ACTN|nr:hypothetical protein [Actinacidiphila bryophytorum]MBM9436385.1 hypothetical protein [Actinacidiphila bryophytorum]MBN6545312.1 hypothetical protein [Actinacidiphila bryophytorum]UWE12532.1 hypothetical protein NYE86_30155 [Actinacidiphila bryophytorum]CAG7602194.1 hypothetical protein SBRY_10504 [Actinacidiphila bryophytorum]